MVKTKKIRGKTYKYGGKYSNRSTAQAAGATGTQGAGMIGHNTRRR